MIYFYVAINLLATIVVFTKKFIHYGQIFQPKPGFGVSSQVIISNFMLLF